MISLAKELGGEAGSGDILREIKSILDKEEGEGDVEVPQDMILGLGLRPKAVGGKEYGSDVITVSVPVDFGIEVTQDNSALVTEALADFLGLDASDVSISYGGGRRHLRATVIVIIKIRVDEVARRWADGSDTMGWSLGHQVSVGDMRSLGKSATGAMHATSPSELLAASVLGLSTECGRRILDGSSDSLPACSEAVTEAVQKCLAAPEASSVLTKALGPGIKLEVVGDIVVVEHEYDGRAVSSDGTVAGDSTDTTEVLLIIAVCVAGAFIFATIVLGVRLKKVLGQRQPDQPTNVASVPSPKGQVLVSPMEDVDEYHEAESGEGRADP